MEIVKNRKARFNYEIIEDHEAGISLVGSEVKSLRDKKVNLTDAYCTFRKNELFMINCRIEPYDKAVTQFAPEPTRSRKLLMHRRELDRLKGKLQQKGWIMVPLKMYFKNNKVKVLVGVGKSKKKFDKRQTIKERDIKRETDREMKAYR